MRAAPGARLLRAGTLLRAGIMDSLRAIVRASQNKENKEETKTKMRLAQNVPFSYEFCR